MMGRGAVELGWPLGFDWSVAASKQNNVGSCWGTWQPARQCRGRVSEHLKCEQRIAYWTITQTRLAHSNHVKKAMGASDMIGRDAMELISPLSQWDSIGSSVHVAARKKQYAMYAVDFVW